MTYWLPRDRNTMECHGQKMEAVPLLLLKWYIRMDMKIHGSVMDGFLLRCKKLKQIHQIYVPD